MDVQFTDEQNLLRDSARDFLTNECSIERVRAVMDDPRGEIDDLWQRMAELGWLGLTFPESDGGSGLDLVDQAVLLEEMGRALLPAPFLSGVAIAGQAIVLAGSEEQRQGLLPQIAEGRLRVTLAQLELGAS